MDLYLVRLKRFAPDRGQPHFTYYHAGIHFRADEYWKRVPEEAALYLKELHQRPGDLRSPLIFDVITEAELPAFAAAEDKAAWEAEVASGRYPPGYFSKIGLTLSPYEKSQPRVKPAPMAPPAAITQLTPASPPARRGDPRDDPEGESAEAAAEDSGDAPGDSASTEDDDDSGGGQGEPGSGGALDPEARLTTQNVRQTDPACPADGVEPGAAGALYAGSPGVARAGSRPRAEPRTPHGAPRALVLSGPPTAARERENRQGSRRGPAVPRAAPEGFAPPLRSFGKQHDSGRVKSPRQGPWPHPRPPA